MNKKTVTIVVCTIIILATVAWFWKLQVNEAGKLSEIVTTTDNQQQMSQDDIITSEDIRKKEIESVADLVTQDYQFEDVDTADWKTYQDETGTIEIKIPSDWYCGRSSLLRGADADAKHIGLSCMPEKWRDNFFNTVRGELVPPEINKINYDVIGVSYNDSNPVWRLNHDAEYERVYRGTNFYNKSYRDITEDNIKNNKRFYYWALVDGTRNIVEATSISSPNALYVYFNNKSLVMTCTNQKTTNCAKIINIMLKTFKTLE